LSTPLSLIILTEADLKGVEGLKMKHGNGFFLELSRHLFTEEYSDLSQNAKWLFVVLNELEQRFTGGKNNKDFFLRSDSELSKDAGMSVATLKRAKSELIKTNLVETWQSHWILDKAKNKLSEKHVTAYRILK
jgi:hypothetical protein